MGLGVLLYVPNIIGYVRLLLASWAFIVFHDPVLFIILYSLSVLLDGLDGYFARRLNQCSAFGAWFDVLIDLFTRGYLWCTLYQGGYLIAFLEWMTFMSTHHRGERWKISQDNFPWLVKRVMGQDFKTAVGMFTVGSLHMLPLWIYLLKFQLLTQVFFLHYELVQLLVTVLLTVGRILCLLVEIFYIKEYVLYLLYVNDVR